MFIKAVKLRMSIQAHYFYTRYKASNLGKQPGVTAQARSKPTAEHIVTQQSDRVR